jgi:type III secretory pathway component EscR
MNEISIGFLIFIGCLVFTFIISAYLMTLDQSSVDTDPFHIIQPSVHAFVIDWSSIRVVLHTLA